jgi:pyruvate dehydrogenase E1 component
LYNENYEMPPAPTDTSFASGGDGSGGAGAVRGLYRWQAAEADAGRRATILFSGSAHTAAREAAGELAEHYGVSAELWSATSYKRLREEALAVERLNRLHPSRPAEVPLVTALLNESSGPITAVTDFMAAVPDQIARFVPAGRPFHVLGTDGMGRSDTREALRRFFEVDTGHVVLTVLTGLVESGDIEPAVLADAIERYGIDPEAADPFVV